MRTYVCFVLALVVTAAAGPVLRILATTGHQMRCLPVVVTTAIVAVVLTAFLADRYGLTGGASGAALALVLNTLLMRRLVIRWVGIRPSVWPARSSGNDP